MPGGSSLLLLDGHKSAILLRQLVQGGSFMAESFCLSGSEPWEHSHCSIITTFDLGIHIVRARGNACTYHRIKLDIIKGTCEETYVRDYQWEEETWDVVTVDLASDQSALHLFGTSPSVKSRLNVLKVNIATGSTVSSHAPLPSSTLSLGDRQYSADSLLTSSACSELLRSSNFLLEFWDNVGEAHLFASTEAELASVEYCLSSNRLLLCARTESGTMYWLPILHSQESLSLATILFDKQSWVDVLLSLRTTVADPLALIRKLLLTVPLHVKKSHFFGTIFRLLDAWPSCCIYAAFFYRLWRVCHFWEVTISCTTEVLDALKILEVGDGDVGRLSFDPAMLVTIADLGCEAAHHMSDLVCRSSEDHQRVLLDRALKVGIILHRILSSLVILQNLAASLQNAAERYTGREGTAALSKHFYLLHSRLSRSMEALDLGRLIPALHEIKGSANLSVQDVLSDDLLVPDDQAIPNLGAIRIHDAVTGRIIVDPIDFCPACATALSRPDSIGDVFWHLYWSCSCPCGAYTTTTTTTQPLSPR